MCSIPKACKQWLITFLLIHLFCASNTLAEGTQFTDEAIDEKINRIKMDIIAKRNLNVRTIGTSSTGHEASGNMVFDSAYIEESRRDSAEICKINNVKNLLSDAVRVNCIPDDLIWTCKNLQEQSHQHAQNLFRHITSFDGGTKSVLRKYHNTLQDALQTTTRNNKMCSSLISEKMFSSACMGVYDQVLDQSLKEQITHQCSTLALDRTVQEFKNAMRNIYVKKIDEVRDAHVNSRNVEVELANKIIEVRAQLKKLENEEPIRTAELNN